MKTIPSHVGHYFTNPGSKAPANHQIKPDRSFTMGEKAHDVNEYPKN
jgi:hypothetical protein